MSRVYETAIKIGASISKAFKSDTYNAAAALTKLTDATKKLKDAEKAATSYKRLDDAVRKSKSRYDQASESLRKLEAAERAAGGATKESTQWRKAGEREVAKAARELDRATKAADKNGKALRAMGVDTSKLSTEQDRLARTLAATERRQESLSRYESARTRLFGARKEPKPLVQKTGDQLRGLASDALLLGTAAAGAGTAMAALVMKSLKAGDEIGDTADKIGIGSTALQELRYGARQSGAETEELDRSLSKMLVTVGRFKAAKGKSKGGGALSMAGIQMLGNGDGGGGGGESNPFNRIGLNAKALSSLKPEEQFKKIADGMAKLKTQADRAAVAQAIFGKGGVAMLPFLSEGSAGIDKLSTSAHRFGGVMSVEAVKAADQADKAMKDAEMAAAGMANTLGAALLPTATKVFGEFSEWVATNRGEIQKWAEKIAVWITTKGIPALKEIGTQVESFGRKVLWLVNGAAKLTGGFDNLAIAVGALRLAPVALNLAKIGVEGFKAAAAIAKYATATAAARAAEEAAGGAGGAAAGGIVQKVMSAAGGGSKALLGVGLGAFAATAATVGGLVYLVKKQQDGVRETEERFNAEHPVDPEAAKFFGTNYARSTKAVMRRGEVQIFDGNGPEMPVTGGGSGTLSFSPTYQIGTDSKEDLGRKLDASHARAKAHLLDEFDRRSSNRRRVSFAE